MQMTPSAEDKKTSEEERETPNGQIDKAVDMYRAMLQKHSHEFPSSSVQTVLGREELAAEQFSVFREQVEREVDDVVIVRHTKVNRTRSFEELIKAFNFKAFVNYTICEMPNGDDNGEEVDVHYFIGKKFPAGSKGYHRQFEIRGLKPVDPYSLASVIEEDPDFASSHSNMTHWNDGKHWGFIAFGRFGQKRLDIFPGSEIPLDVTWLAGIRK